MKTVRARPALWSQLLVVGGFVTAYDAVRALHGHVADQARHDGRQLLHLDRVAHVSWAQPLNDWLAHHHLLAAVLVGYYVIMHLGMTSLTLALLYRRAPTYRRHRNALFAASLMALVVFWFYPAAPPRLLEGFHDTVRHVLPFAYHLETGAANRFAAMPSLHVAWAVWVAVAWRSILGGRTLRGVAWAHPVITAVTVLGTGNHYTSDVVAGALLVPLGYAVVAVPRRVMAARARRASPAASPAAVTALRATSKEPERPRSQSRVSS